MAKKSMIARENRRARAVKKYAVKRAELKAIINNPAGSDEERYQAQCVAATVAASPVVPMATTVNSDFPGTCCARRLCVAMYPGWSRLAGNLL